MVKNKERKMKSTKIKLSKNTQAIYILAKEDNEYSVICIEESSNDCSIEIYKATHITKDKALAKKMFKKITKGKVYGITLLDVIYNLLE
jgi:hypothetical protein